MNTNWPPSPERYRASEICVRDDRIERDVYSGPAPEMVGNLMEALTLSLNEASAEDPMVQAALAHLNLVMIHPLREGNGRMARALQTLLPT